MKVENLLNDIPGGMPEEFVGEILRTDTFRVERIVYRGHASPPGFWYDQETDEWVLLVKGSASLRFFDGREVGLAPGDYLLIPRHMRHRVEQTAAEGETIWLAVYFVGGSGATR